MSDNPLRKLPSVNEVLAALRQSASADVDHHAVLVGAIRVELAELRNKLQQGSLENGVPDASAIASRASDRIAKENRPLLRRVINATGVILHTNLGRAPMAECAA